MHHGGAYGIMQIKPDIWGEQAAALGFDLTTPEGQIGFAAAMLGGAVPGAGGSTPEERFLSTYYPTPGLDVPGEDGATPRQYLDDMHTLMGIINGAAPGGGTAPPGAVPAATRLGVPSPEITGGPPGGDTSSDRLEGQRLGTAILPVGATDAAGRTLPPVGVDAGTSLRPVGTPAARAPGLDGLAGLGEGIAATVKGSLGLDPTKAASDESPMAQQIRAVVAQMVAGGGGAASPPGGPAAGLVPPGVGTPGPLSGGNTTAAKGQSMWSGIYSGTRGLPVEIVADKSQAAAPAVGGRSLGIGSLLGGLGFAPSRGRGGAGLPAPGFTGTVYGQPGRPSPLLLGLNLAGIGRGRAPGLAPPPVPAPAGFSGTSFGRTNPLLTGLNLGVAAGRTRGLPASPAPILGVGLLSGLGDRIRRSVGATRTTDPGKLLGDLGHSQRELLDVQRRALRELGTQSDIATRQSRSIDHQTQATDRLSRTTSSAAAQQARALDGVRHEVGTITPAINRIPPEVRQIPRAISSLNLPTAQDIASAVRHAIPGPHAGGQPSSGGPAHAAGGTVRELGPALVAEEQPEVVFRKAMGRYHVFDRPSLVDLQPGDKVFREHELVRPEEPPKARLDNSAPVEITPSLDAKLAGASTTGGGTGRLVKIDWTVRAEGGSVSNDEVEKMVAHAIKRITEALEQGND